MPATKLLDVPGVVAIETDENGTGLCIEGGGDDECKLEIPLSAAEARELASNLLRWADKVEPPARL